MSIRNLFSTIFGAAVLSTLAVLANAQTKDEAARDLARSVVRSQLHLKPDQFLGIHRDEGLEQYLAIAAVGQRAGSQFIYRLSQTGIEVKENAIVRHVATDADLVYIIAVSSADGSTFRISGFADSLGEFEKLMTASRVRVSGPEQAESVADFYRAVNPENHEGLTPILSVMELKRAAERQCQSHAKSFDAGEKALTAWWKHAEPLYAALPFEPRAVPHGSGHLVEWIVLSSPSSENCGGAPLRVRLEVSAEGHVGKPVFSPLAKE